MLHWEGSVQRHPVLEEPLNIRETPPAQSLDLLSSSQRYQRCHTSDIMFLDRAITAFFYPTHPVVKWLRNLFWTFGLPLALRFILKRPLLSAMHLEGASLLRRCAARFAVYLLPALFGCALCAYLDETW